MTITTDEELEALKAIGRVCAIARDKAAEALRPGVTTAELDAVVRAVLDQHGARSAPEITYGFPGASCISVNEVVAHGIPGDRVIAVGDLVNIDVSAELNGVFADTGASFIVPEANPKLAAHPRFERGMGRTARAATVKRPVPHPAGPSEESRESRESSRSPPVGAARGSLPRPAAVVGQRADSTSEWKARRWGSPASA